MIVALCIFGGYFFTGALIATLTLRFRHLLPDDFLPPPPPTNKGLATFTLFGWPLIILMGSSVAISYCFVMVLYGICIVIGAIASKLQWLWDGFILAISYPYEKTINAILWLSGKS